MDQIKILKRSSFFNSCTQEEIQLFYENMELKKFVPGEYIIQQGKKDKTVYFIFSGSVGVFKTNLNACNAHQINTLKSGDFFGELAMIDNAPRATSIVAMEITDVLCLSVHKINELLQDPGLHKKINSNLLKKICSRLRYTNEITVSSLEKELELKQTQVTAGNFMVLMVVMLTSFTFLLDGISYLNHMLGTASIFTTVAMLLLFVIFWLSAKKTGYPLSFFGFSMKNWGANIMYT